MKAGAGRRQLVQCGQCIAHHGLHIKLPWRLIEPPKGFHTIGVEFKQLPKEPLRDLRLCQRHPIQSAEQDAFPFKGNEIEIFNDRILVNAKGMDFAPILLGYVLTHEIVHLLQGLADHSGIGVMKALWTQDDHSLMRKHNLPLGKEDLDLIQRGSN